MTTPDTPGGREGDRELLEAASKYADALELLADEAIHAAALAAHDLAGPMERQYARETRAELFRSIRHVLGVRAAAALAKGE